MSWFNKAIDKAKDSIDKGIDTAKINMANSMEDAKLQREEEANLRKTFKTTNRSSHIDIDLVNKLWRVAGDKTIYRFESLAGYELIQDGDSITSGGLGIGRAIGGAVIAGPLGAVLGGVTKKRKTNNVVNNLQIRITNKASKSTTSFIDLITKPTKESSKEYKKAAKSAQENLGILDIITSEIE